MAKKKDQSQTPTILPKDGVSRFGQIAPFIPFSRETWRKLVQAGKAPQPIKMGDRCTVYRNAEVHAWLADPVNYRAAQ
ncbi:helix-turn-helix transcriptional regulator [Cupriavidus nantongensis]|uniref:Transcriptional regulator n=1 Tax=Cupriavidus nantongensis TaxID=1796606 RepID=A0A142JGQ7_9BURK|nr:AlpA family phage regulatory protein [Cupriavidus nantongensis]AMR77269.1 transcriptional regulator [Cupriavidus nantongensis]